MARNSASFASALAAVTLVTLVTVAALATPATATAAEVDLAVSLDGTHFTTTELLPVFSDELRLVPGDSESAEFWIRNDSAHAGLLRLDLIDPVSIDPLFATHLELTAAPRGSASAPVTLSTAITNGSCTVLSGDRVLAPGQSTRVQVTAALSSDLADEQGALGELRFRMRAVLADAVAAAVQPAGTACTAPPYEGGGARPQLGPTSSPGALAATGRSLPLTAVGVGGVATVAGMLAFLCSRRRRIEGDEADA